MRCPPCFGRARRGIRVVQFGPGLSECLDIDVTPEFFSLGATGPLPVRRPACPREKALVQRCPEASDHWSAPS
ncbi:hypothetical protein C791_4493 [Amycolatopsis azurea DSM 43854]|uniref:Uncharacterized protein n=1 Tax=Amycolatopsis azurea DSM 43854 TaxID=1238180 RepID=M2Q0W9_9PSEU|nr:hypothetical protein C791_4493 [Amycolatopsis azurea DSM 43854]